MAVIGTIRNRFGWLLIGFMIIVLLLFVLSSAMDNINQLFGGQNNKNVGSVAGHSISVEDFSSESAEVEKEMLNGNPPNEQQRQQIREVAWTRLIEKYSLNKEIDKLGLTVTEEELKDITQGNNIDPSFQQIPIFQDPVTRQFDRTRLKRFTDSIAFMPAQQQKGWNQYKESIRKKRMRDKYDNLFRLSAYTTKAEAKREYEAQTTKTDIKYLFVPYYSVPDSTIKVSDDQLKDYYNKHKDKFKSRETRTIQYVTFQIMPSKEDSAYFLKEIVQAARDIAVAQNDSLYAASRSDVPFPYEYKFAHDLPPYLQESVKTFIKGAINGPYKEGSMYAIYKLVDVKEDTVPAFKMSHILMPKDTSSAEAKKESYDKAVDLLNRIKKGESFEQAATQFNNDATKYKGGDLGWYRKGNGFVKEFEDAVYKFNKVGLINKVVETQFGYHIIKITDGPVRTMYKLAGVQKNITYTDATREQIYRRASTLAANSKTLEDLQKEVKKDPTLQLLTADKIDPNAENLNTLTGAREIVRWANDAKVGEVRQEAFSITDQFFVVAGLAGKTEKGDDDWKNFKDQLGVEVRKEIKAEQTIAKLNGKTGSLEDISKGFGVTAQVGNVPELKLGSPTVGALGNDAVALGKAFGLKEGQRSKPFAGENGVIIVESTNLSLPTEIADYSLYKNQLNSANQGSASRLAEEAIKEASKIEDKRYKIF